MEQTQALEIMKSGANVFLTGMAGTGKSYVLNQFIDWCDDNGRLVGITASTGIAATHINGTTIHSWSGIGIHNEKSLTEEVMDKIANNPYVSKTLQQTHILIIDEISMLHSFQLDAIDYICRKSRRDEEPFGGIQIILTGDFLQLPPVSKNDAVKYAFESAAWSNASLEICYLATIYRQDDPEFIQILNEVRYGKIVNSSFDKLLARVNKKIEVDNPTELYPINKDVDYINTYKLDQIQKPMSVFPMTCYGDEGGVNFLKRSCLSPEKLCLKEGAQVIFTRNNFKEGYSNGTFGIVTHLGKFPTIKLASGKEIVVEKGTWEMKKYNSQKRVYEVTASISQFPLKLAYALTTHKSQGFTLEYAKMNLTNLFSFNMGYVALSRVKSLKNISFVGIDESIYLVDSKLLEKDMEFKNSSLSTKPKESKKSDEIIL